jgi:hypothetical protein
LHDFWLGIIDEIDSLEASARALKSRQNELAPVSCLQHEVLAAIFSFLPVFAWKEGSSILAWIRVTHVCRRWRETALNHPHFWSRIDLTKLKLAVRAEILSRSKMAPLHLKAITNYFSDTAHLESVGKQLEAHISHTRHLKLSGPDLSTVVDQLTSPTPTLEYLFLSHEGTGYGPKYATIPDNLFNYTAPSLTSLTLRGCKIGWKLPILKGLRILKILDLSVEARPELDDWLGALNEMSQLKELFLRSATPLAWGPLADPLISCTVTLPSLAYFHIDASTGDCALALAHLTLPALTRLHVHVKSHREGGEDTLLVIPYVVRNACVLQGIKPIRSALIAGERHCTKVLTWTMPGADVKACAPSPCTLVDMPCTPCLQFTAKGRHWIPGVDSAIFDALLTLFPLNSVSTLTAQNRTRLSKESWLRHAPKLPLLEQACLVPTAVGAFREMLIEDIPLDSDGPQLPMLTKLILLDVRLTPIRMLHLRDTLIERVEQGVPLEYLDLRTCNAPDCAIQLLAEIVVDVRGPLPEVARSMTMEEFFDEYGIEYDEEVEFADGWYDDYTEDEDDDEWEW